jgi:Zn-dependent peptidase ImmA (M78 family)
VKLLTDGAEKSPVLGFCLNMISQHGENWPPEDEVLAHEFVNWFGLKSFPTRSCLKVMCKAKGIDLSFASLPQDIHGSNFLFQDKKEIVIAERELAPFGDSHTLLHEFREMLEHVFVELGYPTISARDSLEEQAELFAGLCRMDAGAKELPAVLEMVQQVEKKWARYLGYVFVAAFALAYMFTCVYMRQLEEIGSEVHRQRYVRT